MLGARYLFGDEFAAAGNLNRMTTDRSSQSLTGRLANPGRLLELKRFGGRRGKNGASERMFRIQLKTRRECKHFFLCETRRDKLFR